MSAKSQIEEAGNMFADDSGEMSAANFKIAMRALPKICGFPSSEEVTRALKMYGGSGGRVNVSSYVRVMTDRASKCSDFDSELRKLGNNPFEKLKTGGDIKTVGTLIDVLCSRNKDTKESFTKQEMKMWQDAAGFYLGGQNNAYDAADMYKKSVELLKREG